MKFTIETNGTSTPIEAKTTREAIGMAKREAVRLWGSVVPCFPYPVRFAGIASFAPIHGGGVVTLKAV